MNEIVALTMAFMNRPPVAQARDADCRYLMRREVRAVTSNDLRLRPSFGVGLGAPMCDRLERITDSSEERCLPCRRWSSR
jgi:hypothetical protein